MKQVKQKRHICYFSAHCMNDQRMKFEGSQKNYNKNGNNKIKPNENNPFSNPSGNNSKLIVP